MNWNWSYSPETPNSGQNRWFFCPVWPWNLMDDPEKTIGHIFNATSSFVDHFVAISERASFFVPCYLEIWWMTLKNNRAPLLRYFKLFFLIVIGEFKLELQSGNAQIAAKLAIFCPVSRISATCDKSVWKNDITCKWIYGEKNDTKQLEIVHRWHD